MRCTIMILFVALFFTACQKEQLASTTRLNETVFAPTNGSGNGSGNNGIDTSAVLKHAGSFSSGPYGSASGNAEIYKTGANAFVLLLNNFSVSNGPALHVYVSVEAMPVNFIDLGVLKSTNGNQVYLIPGTPDFSNFKYISIHCVAYNHLFGSALLN